MRQTDAPETRCSIQRATISVARNAKIGSGDAQRPWRFGQNDPLLQRRAGRLSVICSKVEAAVCRRNDRPQGVGLPRTALPVRQKELLPAAKDHQPVVVVGTLASKWGHF